MTVITTIISQFCTIHASDSYITRRQPDGSFKLVSETTKIIRVPRWKGAMSYFGSTHAGSDWNILDFLNHQVDLSGKCADPEEFADFICDALSRIPALEKEGVGIHFTAYENCDGYPIPELFMITNLKNADGGYEIHPEGLDFRRETYAKIQPKTDSSLRAEHCKSRYRHQVREFLESGNMYIYNNGDPVLFNLSVNCIFGMLQIANERNLFRQFRNVDEHHNLAIWPIEQVKRLQESFFVSGHQIVGGSIHSLSITPEGKYQSRES